MLGTALDTIENSASWKTLLDFLSDKQFFWKTKKHELKNSLFTSKIQLKAEKEELITPRPDILFVFTTILKTNTSAETPSLSGSLLLQVFGIALDSCNIIDENNVWTIRKKDRVIKNAPEQQNNVALATYVIQENLQAYLLEKRKGPSQKRKSVEVIAFPQKKPNLIISSNENNDSHSELETFTTLDRTKTNLNALPVVDNDYPLSRTEITLGDMHGNAIKLIHLLIKHRILTGITENEYQILLNIYQTPIEELTQHNLLCFKDIVNKLQRDTSAAPCFIRFIGDLFVDRGNNDCYTLLVLKALTDLKIPFEVLISNHDSYFISFVKNVLYDENFSIALLEKVLQPMDFMDNMPSSPLEEEITRIIEFASREYSPGCLLGSSFLNFLALLTSQILSLEDFKTIIDRSGYYKENVLKPISYTLSPDKKQIHYFTHAPIGDTLMFNIAQRLGFPINNIACAKDFAHLIEQLNKYFNRFPDFAGEGDTAFSLLMWNRKYPQSKACLSYTKHTYGHHRPTEIQKSLLPNAESIDGLLGISNKYFIENDATLIQGYAQPLSNALMPLKLG